MGNVTLRKPAVSSQVNAGPTSVDDVSDVTVKIKDQLFSVRSIFVNGSLSGRIVQRKERRREMELLRVF